MWKDRIIAGSPEECVAEFRRWGDAVGTDYFLLRLRHAHSGGPPHDEIMRAIGNRPARKTLGITIPFENLYTKAMLPAARRGRTGISPRLEKLPFKEIKIIGRMPAIKTKNISGDSLEFFFVKFIDRLITSHRISSIPPTRVIPIETFLPRWMKIMLRK